ncbi:hypothetical protein [Rahnella perminowiae]|uniref:hypothetical protein n=1 Tax=Rahnella perminowiae TaxID=2816244 RepID=UPI001C268BEC|nr:hypothetical protein [Rahnella perminowiae]MBU9827969.1 hypothetical protein [Rahnella perminowiae]
MFPFQGTIIIYNRALNLRLLVVILVVLTEREFRFSLLISQLMAKAIPVRGAKFREARLRKLKRAFCFSCPVPRSVWL